MKRIFAFFAFIALLCACSVSGSIPCGPEMTKDFGTVGDYSAVEASGAVAVTYSDTATVMYVTSDSASLDGFRMSLRNGTLSLGRKSGTFGKNGGCGVVHVILPASASLSHVELSGASSFDAELPVESGDFYIRLSGASSFKAEIHVGELDVIASGASGAKLYGTASKASYSVSGASKVSSNDSHVMSDEVSADVSGASKLVAGCSGTVSGSVSGASSFLCHGDCSTDVNVTGASAFRRF